MAVDLKAGGLRCVARSVDTLSPAGQVSDRLEEFGERRDDPQCERCVRCEFVVAAAQTLQEGVAGNHQLRGRSVVSRASVSAGA
jgi:hypothetical protein